MRIVKYKIQVEGILFFFSIITSETMMSIYIYIYIYYYDDDDESSKSIATNCKPV